MPSCGCARKAHHVKSAAPPENTHLSIMHTQTISDTAAYCRVCLLNLWSATRPLSSDLTLMLWQAGRLPECTARVLALAESEHACTLLSTKPAAGGHRWAAARPLAGVTAPPRVLPPCAWQEPERQAGMLSHQRARRHLKIWDNGGMHTLR